MKSKIITWVLCLIVAALASESTLARGGRGGHWGHGGHRHGGVHWGVVIGAPLGLGWYNPYPYWSNPPPYWYDPPVVVQSAPPVYIEREAAPAAGDDDAYFWYHCARPEGYYPYIKDCPGGWKKVVPTPPQN